jgi:hypothetical protein
LQFVAISEFEHIEKLIDEAGEKYIIGTISATKLFTKHWWKQNGNSIVVLPDGIVEKTTVSPIKLKSVLAVEMV